MPGWACATFVLGMLTDVFDGYFARLLNQQTRLGLFLDAVIDKIVIIGMFYELAWYGLIPMAFAHLFLARELLQNAVRSVAATQSRQVVTANVMGKIKAALQTMLIICALAYLTVSPTLNAETREMVELSLRIAALGILAVSWVFLGLFISRNRAAIAGTECDGGGDC